MKLNVLSNLQVIMIAVLGLLIGVSICLCICIENIVKLDKQNKIMKSLIHECEQMDTFDDTVGEGDSYYFYLEECK